MLFHVLLSYCIRCCPASHIIELFEKEKVCGLLVHIVDAEALSSFLAGRRKEGMLSKSAAF